MSFKTQWFMYEPISAAAITGAATAIGTSVYNQQSMAKSNLRSRQFADTLSFRQREWALQDWKMQNEYNSPVEQRKRMIAAGMNPALMYGQGGNSGMAAPVRASPSEGWRSQPHQIQGNPLGEIYEIVKTVAATNLLHAQSDAQKEAARKNRIDNDANENFAQGHEGKTYSDARNEHAYELGQIMEQFQLRENERRDLYSAANSEQVAERIALMAVQRAESEARKKQILENIELLKKSGQLKQFEIDGNEILNKQFTGPAAQVLLGLLKKFDIIR